MKKVFSLFIAVLFMAMAYSQNVGIGTTTPLMKLHVASSDSALLVLENVQTLNTNISNSLYFKTGSGTYPYTGAIKTIGQGSSIARLGFFTYASADANGLLERMSITDNGYVGIGVNTPLDVLHVAGNIRMVDGNQVAGRVMTSDNNGTGTWKDLASKNSGFRAYVATNQIIPSGSETLLGGWTLEYDDGGHFASNAFTASATGVYHFDLLLGTSFNSITGNSVALQINGTDKSKTITHDGYANLSIDMKLNAGDVVTVAVFQASGSSIVVYGNQPYCVFTGHRVY